MEMCSYKKVVQLSAVANSHGCMQNIGEEWALLQCNTGQNSLRIKLGNPQSIDRTFVSLFGEVPVATGPWPSYNQAPGTACTLSRRTSIYTMIFASSGHLHLVHAKRIFRIRLV